MGLEGACHIRTTSCNTCQYSFRILGNLSNNLSLLISGKLFSKPNTSGSDSMLIVLIFQDFSFSLDL